MKVWLRIIAILEIVGGLSGIGWVAWAVLVRRMNVNSLLVALLVFGIYGLSLAAGVALLRAHSFARTASMVVQLIQIPKIVSPAVIFMFSFGFDAWIWIYYYELSGLSKIGFEFRILGANQIFFKVADAPIGLGISITAIIFLAILSRHKPAANSPEPPPLPAEFVDQYVEAQTARDDSYRIRELRRQDEKHASTIQHDSLPADSAGWRSPCHSPGEAGCNSGRRDAS